ncbi:metallophosphoesterase [Roseisalinus antarcticus]|uniref:Diadenosine tetraphosphatase n=1 Tax=Roseisalinus antarcticus TaxID=254357 RepID=A0A1Y5S6M2_9RHOB|nr:metallophosphoesterase [Roseisalinus antarcticus]SLN33691.1 diadenosine tetraphosphatase [Roseisalinus antarcticus]
MHYVIGDIHGQAAELDRALALIEADGGPDAPITFLGDYTDRGPDSRGVLQRLIEGRDAGRPWRFLLGNHDRMFLRFVTQADQHDTHILSGKGWLHPALGGPMTLASYGIDVGDTTRTVYDISLEARARIDPAHMAFLRDLPLYIEEGPNLFVHAGIRPGVPLAEQTEEDLIWIREGFLDHEDPFPWTIVHGHTALDAPAHFGNRIDLDGGAGYGRPLVPAVFDGQDWHTLSDIGRHLLWPEI